MHKYVATVQDKRGSFKVQYRAKTVKRAWAWFKAQFPQDEATVTRVMRVR